jgi:septum formation protein
MTLNNSMNKKIVLASQSPRRKELLKYILPDFDVSPSNIDETIAPGTSPEDAVKSLSHDKALTVAAKFSNSLVIGSDTVVVFGDKIIGKANSREEAKATLHMLSGKEHFVLSAVTIIDTDTKATTTEVVKTVVKFSEIPEQMLNEYLDSGEYEDKAGSYAIQGKGAIFVEYINGDFYNVIGFPINTIYKMLDKLSAIPRKSE